MRLPKFISRWLRNYYERRYQKEHFGVSGEKIAGSEAVLNNHLMTCRVSNGVFEGDLFMVYFPGSGEKNSSAVLIPPYEVTGLVNHFGARESLRGKRLYVYGLKVSSLELMAGIQKEERVDSDWFEERFGKKTPVYLIEKAYPVRGIDFESARVELDTLPVRDK